MKSAKKSCALVALSLLVAVGCSSTNKDSEKQAGKDFKPTPVAQAIYESTEVPQATTVQTQGTDQVDFASIEFDRGEAKLSEMDRRHINELAMKMTVPGKVVDDVKIVTWSDKVVKNGQEASNTDIVLARKRAESIKEYITRNLPQPQAQEDASFYNMAENPERFGSYMERKGIPLDQAFIENGQPVSPDGRGLVIIEYQNGPSSSQL
jgi:outer membrane protein OmpA-like peptidoglycan-associated protein